MVRKKLGIACMGVGAGAKRRKDARKDGAKKAIYGEQRREKE
jgi:hypothetical protein